MKCLSCTIKESLIMEGAFAGGDWLGVHSQDYKYPKMVIHDLLNDKPVKLQAGGELSLKDFDKQKLEELASKLERCPELTDYKDFNQPYIGGQINKRKKNVFLAIDKLPYSGATSNSLGETAESLVCYLFNNGASDENIEKWVNLSKKQLDKIYYKSCKEIVNLLYSNWKNTDYEAVHVDGKDYDTNLNKYSKYIAMIFKSKSLGKQVLGFNIDDLYAGKKDKWNPGDIILINKKHLEDSWLRLQEIAKDNAQGIFGKPLGVVLASLCEEEAVIPVSLKKCIKYPKIFSHCVEQENATSFRETNISLASRYVKDKLNGSIYLISLSDDDNTCTVQFRAQDGNNNNLSIESFLQSKSARGGKGLTVIKSALGIPPRNNNYYATFKSNEELADTLKNLGFSIAKNLNKSKKDQMNSSLYTRTCVRGLIGLILKFKDHVEKQGDKYEPVKFAEFCWQACCSCPGAYYAVHD